MKWRGSERTRLTRRTDLLCSPFGNLLMEGMPYDQPVDGDKFLIFGPNTAA